MNTFAEQLEASMVRMIQCLLTEEGESMKKSGSNPKHDVFIHKQYFPKELHPKGVGNEALEQWKVHAPSRQAAAEKIWKQHGDRLLGLMNPHVSSVPRKVSLHVSNPKTGTAPGRLDPVTVHNGWKGTTFRHAGTKDPTETK